jgi:hypothetical protein
MNAVEIKSFRLAVIAGLIAVGLTIFVEKSHGKVIVPFFFPLMPGLVAGLLVTGGHGGTAIQENVAIGVAAFINAAFYVVIILVARWMWRSLIARPNA